MLLKDRQTNKKKTDEKAVGNFKLAKIRRHTVSHSWHNQDDKTYVQSDNDIMISFRVRDDVIKWKHFRVTGHFVRGIHWSLLNYINPGYGLSLVDTLWNASSYRQPLEQEGNPMT